MDNFGIGQAMEGMAIVYFQSARATGRTVSMLENVKDGDRIYFSTAKEKLRVEKLLAEMGKTVECVVIKPDNPSSVFERGSSQGRAIFDHSWVEEYYLNAIRRAGEEIDHFERETSGYGEPHRETRRKAEEMAKWRIW